jgi:hypothetical protein
LAASKEYCRLLNIGTDQILVSTKCWSRQNTPVDKMLASNKYSRRQNVGVDKILVSTKYSLGQNPRIDKNLASPYCLAWQSPQQLTSLISYVSKKVLIPPHAVAKCVVATGRPAFIGGLSPALYWFIVLACHAENVTNIGINKILAPTKISLIFAKL